MFPLVFCDEGYLVRKSRRVLNALIALSVIWKLVFLLHHWYKQQALIPFVWEEGRKSVYTAV